MGGRTMAAIPVPKRIKLVIAPSQLDPLESLPGYCASTGKAPHASRLDVDYLEKIRKQIRSTRIEIIRRAGNILSPPLSFSLGTWRAKFSPNKIRERALRPVIVSRCSFLARQRDEDRRKLSADHEICFAISFAIRFSPLFRRFCRRETREIASLSFSAMDKRIVLISRPVVVVTQPRQRRQGGRECNFFAHSRKVRPPSISNIFQ